MVRTSRSRTATGLLVAALAATGPAGSARAASDATVSLDGDTITMIYRAGGGERNNPSVTGRQAGDDLHPISIYTFRDVGPIVPGEGCSRPDPADPLTAECLIRGDPQDGTHFEFYLGDQVDHVDQVRVDSVIVHGGPGDDVLNLGDRGSVAGDEGDDILIARGGSGGPGDDRMIVSGYGSGDDGDDQITGQDQSQELLGGPGNDTIEALAGNDSVSGGPGHDLIRGGTGRDTLSGGPGNDRVYGNSGDDRLLGGTGRDFLSGGPGADRLYGNSGNDTLLGGAGRDFLSGGPGNDEER